MATGTVGGVAGGSGTDSETDVLDDEAFGVESGSFVTTAIPAGDDSGADDESLSAILSRLRRRSSFSFNSPR